MPLHGREPLRQASEQRVVRGGRQQLDLVPADLVRVAAVHLAARGLGQHLRPEAQPDVGR